MPLSLQFSELKFREPESPLYLRGLASTACRVHARFTLPPARAIESELPGGMPMIELPPGSIEMV